MGDSQLWEKLHNLRVSDSVTRRLEMDEMLDISERTHAVIALGFWRDVIAWILNF